MIRSSSISGLLLAIALLSGCLFPFPGTFPTSPLVPWPEAFDLEAVEEKIHPLRLNWQINEPLSIIMGHGGRHRDLVEIPLRDIFIQALLNNMELGNSTHSDGTLIVMDHNLRAYMSATNIATVVVADFRGDLFFELRSTHSVNSIDFSIESPSVSGTAFFITLMPGDDAVRYFSEWFIEPAKEAVENIVGRLVRFLEGQGWPGVVDVERVVIRLPEGKTL